MSSGTSSERAVRFMSALLVVIGIAVILRTVQAGAGVTFATGYLLGGVLVLAGVARALLARAQRDGGGEH